MKKNRFYYLSLFALAAGALSACSSEETMSDVVGPDGATAYAKVSISFTGADRFGARSFGSGTGEFENGTTDESQIKSLLFVFYDEDGRPVGHTKLTGTTTPPIPPVSTNTSGSNVQDQYTVEVPVSLAPGSKTPTQIMCFANPQSESDQYVSLTEVYGLTRDKYKTSDGFTMNNSVYYNGQNRVIATQIPANGIKMENATTPATLASTEIYIERIATKVSVSAPTLTVAPYEINSTTYLKFVPAYWSVTATEKSIQLVKDLPATLDGNSDDVKGFINGTNRTFWAHSVNYKPTFDPTNFPMTGWDVNADTKLNYLSYKEISDKKPTAEGTTAWGGSQYFFETTGRDGRLSYTTINGNLSLPNAIIVGEYKVYKDKAMTQELSKFNTADGFYRYASDLFTKDEIIMAMLSNHETYLRTAENTPLTETQIKSLFAMSAVKKFYRNNQLTDAAKHYTAPQATATSLIENLQYYNGTAWTDVTTENLDDFNLFIVKQTNCAISYICGGKAFFTVLIEHNGKKGNNIIEGTYGLVRNHTYKITVTKIAGLASGVNNINDPLLPMADEFAKFKVDAKLNVLSWHVVTQQVEL